MNSHINLATNLQITRLPRYFLTDTDTNISCGQYLYESISSIKLFDIICFPSNSSINLLTSRCDIYILINLWGLKVIEAVYLAVTERVICSYLETYLIWKYKVTLKYKIIELF